MLLAVSLLLLISLTITTVATKTPGTTGITVANITATTPVLEGPFGGQQSGKHYQQAARNKKSVRQEGAAKGGAATVQVNAHMVGTVILGGEPFQLIFDTGSDNLWVFGEHVNKDYFREAEDEEAGRGGPPAFIHRYYDKTKSETFKPIRRRRGGGSAMSLAYDDGYKVSGELGLETVQIPDLDGGRRGVAINLERCSFGITNKLEGPKYSLFTNHDGIIGLKYHLDTTFNVSPFARMAQEHAQGNDGAEKKKGFLLHRDLFSVYMPCSILGSGEIMFGDIDTRRFKGELRMANVVLPGEEFGEGAAEWLIRVERLRFFGTTHQHALRLNQNELDGEEHKLTAVLDTGSSDLVLPRALFQTLKNNDSSSRNLKDALDPSFQNFGYVPQGGVGALPKLGITIDGTEYVLTGEEYSSAEAGFEDKEGKRWCMLFLELDPPAENKMIIGMPFMRKYYTVFANSFQGRRGPQIGFAKKAIHQHHH